MLPQIASTGHLQNTSCRSLPQIIISHQRLKVSYGTKFFPTESFLQVTARNFFPLKPRRRGATPFQDYLKPCRRGATAFQGFLKTRRRGTALFQDHLKPCRRDATAFQGFLKTRRRGAVKRLSHQRLKVNYGTKFFPTEEPLQVTAAFPAVLKASCRLRRLIKPPG
jgi:hypothetical protein